MYLILIILNVHVASVYYIRQCLEQIACVSNCYIRSSVKAETASIPVISTKRANLQFRR